MRVVYPSCPACGKPHRGRPLYTGQGSYPYGVIHDHAGCDVTKYVVRVHPDGRVETLTTMPGHRRLESYGSTAI